MGIVDATLLFFLLFFSWYNDEKQLGDLGQFMEFCCHSYSGVVHLSKRNRHLTAEPFGAANW
jgi:hypothetical protein